MVFANMVLFLTHSAPAAHGTYRKCREPQSAAFQGKLDRHQNNRETRRNIEFASVKTVHLGHQKRSFDL